MSYFLITTGAVPSVDDIRDVRLVPAKLAQAYVVDIVCDIVGSADQAATYLLDDGTQTSDTVVAEASDHIQGGRGIREHTVGTGDPQTTRCRLLDPRLVALTGGRLATARCL